MNVLSLFDGMSCGRIALERAGIKVDNYFASEIDKHAIKVSKANWNDIIHIGDVTKVKYENGVLYTEFGQYEVKIDMVIGGSPCQGFSFEGKQLAFEDIRSKLYFKFEQLVEQCNPEFFLLENVNMRQEYKDVISERLCVEPVKINSNLVSAQNRNRLYWTNIPNVLIPEDKNILYKDIKDMSGNYDYWKDFQMEKFHTGKYVRKDYYRVEQDECKVQCLLAQFGQNHPKTWHGEKLRYLTPLEFERLQTVPDNYTQLASTNQRYKMLGNGWTVDVIAHIFKGIKQC